MRACWRIAVLACAYVNVAVTEGLANPTSADSSVLTTLTIGRATRDVSDEKKRWQRLLTTLNDSDNTQTRPAIDLRITSSKAGLLWDFWDQKIQIFIGKPFLAASLIREAAAVPLLVIEESEPSSQRSVVIVRESDKAKGWGRVERSPIGLCKAWFRSRSSFAALNAAIPWHECR